jgi:hypothetical protein
MSVLDNREEESPSRCSRLYSTPNIVYAANRSPVLEEKFAYNLA